MICGRLPCRLIRHTSRTPHSQEFDRAWLEWLDLHQQKRARQHKARGRQSLRSVVDSVPSIVERNTLYAKFALTEMSFSPESRASNQETAIRMDSREGCKHDATPGHQRNDIGRQLCCYC